MRDASEPSTRGKWIQPILHKTDTGHYNEELAQIFLACLLAVPTPLDATKNLYQFLCVVFILNSL